MIAGVTVKGERWDLTGLSVKGGGGGGREGRMWSTTLQYLKSGN